MCMYICISLSLSLSSLAYIPIIMNFVLKISRLQYHILSFIIFLAFASFFDFAVYAGELTV